MESTHRGGGGKDHNIQYIEYDIELHDYMIMQQSQYIHAFIRKALHSIMLYNGDW